VVSSSAGWPRRRSTPRARARGWFKNGAIVTGSGGDFKPAGGGQVNWQVARTKLIQLNGSTDYVELVVFQNSGGALNTVVGAGGDPSGMSVSWVHS